MSHGIGIEKQISLVKQQLQPADYLDQLMSFKYNIDHNRNSQLWSIDSFSGLSRCPYTSRCPWQSCNLVFKQKCYVRTICSIILVTRCWRCHIGTPLCASSPDPIQVLCTPLSPAITWWKTIACLFYIFVFVFKLCTPLSWVFILIQPNENPNSEWVHPSGGGGRHSGPILAFRLYK